MGISVPDNRLTFAPLEALPLKIRRLPYRIAIDESPVRIEAAYTDGANSGMGGMDDKAVYTVRIYTAKKIKSAAPNNPKNALILKDRISPRVFFSILLLLFRVFKRLTQSISL